MWVCNDKLELKRQSMEWKTTDSPVMKNFRVELSLNKVMRTVFYDIKGSSTIDFQEKGATLNTYSNCQPLP